MQNGEWDDVPEICGAGTLPGAEDGTDTPVCTKPLSNILVKILQIVAHRNHELIGVSSVDSAVVVTQHQPDNVAHGD